MSDTDQTSTDVSTPSDAPSSSAVETTDAPATGATVDPSSPSSGTDSQASPSSGDNYQSDREGLLAVVRKVVDKAPADADATAPGTAGAAPGTQPGVSPDKVVQGAPGAPPADKPPGAQTAAATPDPDDPNAPDPTDAELRKLRPETRKRFERLLGQRNEARTLYEQVQPELVQHRQLQGYLQQHQLAPDDVNLLLGVGAALRRGDYQAFLDGVTPYVINAQEALGVRIANDLHKQVEDGEISEAAARELTRNRHRALLAEHRMREMDTARTSEQQDQTVQSIRQAVDAWEYGIRSRDPDYPHMANAVRRYSQALMQERGIPQNPQQAVALTQAAYEEAKRELLALRPRPQPTRVTPSGVQGRTNGSAHPEPRNMKEAALAALDRMRGAS